VFTSTDKVITRKEKFYWLLLLNCNARDNCWRQGDTKNRDLGDQAQSMIHPVSVPPFYGHQSCRSPIELYPTTKSGQTSYIVHGAVIVRVRNDVRIDIGVTSGAPEFIIVVAKVLTAVLVPSMDVDVKVATSDIMLAGRVSAPTADVERIVEVAVSVKVVDGSLTVETRVWVVMGIPVLGPTEVEKIVEVAVSTEVVDGSLTVETRVWVATGIPVLGPTEVEKIVEVAVSTKVVDSSLTVETRVWVATGIAVLEPTDVEKMVEVAVSVKVVDHSTTVERVVWVPTGIMQPMVPDWLKSIPSASSEPPVIIAFVQVGDI
jgi:hypothetical protein